jgi:hypothetical protein
MRNKLIGFFDKAALAFFTAFALFPVLTIVVGGLLHA